MVPLNMIYIVITLILFGIVVGIPENLMCCPPGVGSYRFKNGQSFCWNDKINKTSSIVLPCNLTEAYDDDALEYKITEDGELLWVLENGYMEVESGTICLANHTENNNGTYEYKNNKLMVVCVIEHSDNILEGYCKVVSSFFLILTSIFYIALPEIRDLQGKSIANFCMSLGIGLAILGFMNITTYSDMNLCAVRGFLVYFFIIASFFWTNAISVQILQSLRRTIVNNYSWKAFSWYALYAWGCPILLTTGMAIVNFIPGEHLKPGIGLNHCWFFDTKQQWRYMYSVMTILILLNMCIFIYASVHIWRLTFKSSHIKALKYKFVMTLRLIIIMGLPWIFEMISSLISNRSVIWYILDLFNMLQGILIFFLLVVFRKRVIKALLKHGLLDCVAGPVERYLAVKDDEEEGVVQHTIDLTIDARDGRNGI